MYMVALDGILSGCIVCMNDEIAMNYICVGLIMDKPIVN